jgi:hypothetical protein
MAALNSIVATYAAQNNIPVINYGDALCSCVGSAGGVVQNILTNTQYEASVTAGSSGPLAPTAAGYGLMSKMAATAIATMGATIKGGYLQDLATQLQNDYQATNVNTVGTGTNVQFTPMGVYSNGVTESITNTNFTGSSGAWASSNPLVMYINQAGLAFALSAGTATITYTSPSGVKFSEWIMYITAP